MGGGGGGGDNHKRLSYPTVRLLVADIERRELIYQIS